RATLRCRGRRRIISYEVRNSAKIVVPMAVRTRFAPSPTGYLHIGGARTALFSWAYARHQCGQFILRVEDTDLERSTQASVDAIIDGMRWLGIHWDEGPLFQMQRLERYRQAAEQLIGAGHAYYDYMSREELEALRKDQAARGDDHVNNTPRQIHIFRALGAALPEFGHVPMILGADGERLSKRHGAVSVMQYRDEGYLPEALLNYLARLGWSHGDDELFSTRQF